MATRRPLVPIAEKGKFHKPVRKTIWDKIEDGAFIAITIALFYPLYLISQAFEYITRKRGE